MLLIESTLDLMRKYLVFVEEHMRSLGTFVIAKFYTFLMHIFHLIHLSMAQRCGEGENGLTFY